MKLHSSFSDFSSLSVDSLTSGRRKGTLSAQELGEAVIAASAAREPRVRAWSSFVPGAVRKSYEELGSPIGKGPLWGVPFGVKDIIDVKGMPTEYGSPLYDGNVARTDAACVALLRAAGAVPVGKTVTAEFAFSCPGPTTNPWNEKHTPGGSSSGSAAAVAAGMVPFALGTQTGGSVIRPAAYCGVVGFKTSRDAVARAGVKAVSETLDTVGWFARSVEDAATIAAVLLPWNDLPAKPDKPLRVALVGEGGLGALSAEARAALLHAVTDLRGAGVHVEEIDCAASQALLTKLHRTVMTYEMARSLAHEFETGAYALSAILLNALKDGARVPTEDYLAALHALRQEERRLAQQLGGFDCVMTPSGAGPAPSGLASTGESTFNRTWSALGWPAIHLPTTASKEALPLGVQLVGKHGADEVLFHQAAALHRLIDRRSRVTQNAVRRTA
jgi:Asp-tRNA(Asn)/Glu-tRNA(Gln) amidotransferase A subunit family amidase